VSTFFPDLAQTLAIAGFGLVKRGNAAASQTTLLHWLALLQLFTTVTALLGRGGPVDEVSGAVAPGVLALNALQWDRLPVWDGTVYLFSFHLARQLPGTLLWLVAAAVCAYYDYTSLWFTVAFAALAIHKGRMKSQEGYITTGWALAIATTLITGFVLYRNATLPWAVVIMLAMTASSIVKTVGGFVWDLVNTVAG
jgi:hypothetical protein